MNIDNFTRTGLRQLLKKEEEYHEELMDEVEELEEQLKYARSRLTASEVQQRLLARKIRQMAREED